MYTLCKLRDIPGLYKYFFKYVLILSRFINVIGPNKQLLAFKELNKQVQKILNILVDCIRFKNPFQTFTLKPYILLLILETRFYIISIFSSCLIAALS